MIKEYIVSSTERHSIWELAKEIFTHTSDHSDKTIFSNSLIVEAQLELKIREELYRLSRTGEYDAIIFRQLVDNSLIDIETPNKVRIRRNIDYIFEIIPLLLMSATGFPIAYEVQHNGRIINDVLPVEEFKNIDNSTAGVAKRFNLHTEDAYHNFPPDFIGLFCIRNNEKAATLVSILSDNIFTDKDYSSLFEKLFINQANAGSAQNYNYEVKRAILFGQKSKPNIRLNTARLPQIDNKQISSLLSSFVDILNENSQRVVLQSGDMIIMNNLRCVHGRDAFETDFSVEKRWLLRVLSRRDIAECLVEPFNVNVLL
ncbi:TauD/TfdA family dioxygenase [Spirosoma sp. BT702]|uniref:TauD/TfdA family dioxygenase n=1 Tax=Spirosoma profusum TaxID=2771354 RepID=A0A926XTH3_9BACT|nr:TauD/TfdA family dioxygenase [Spirosoma profusum]MBD2699474.1 TauD/TfdA family dioxygenase [Spirosoma profusum]